MTSPPISTVRLLRPTLDLLPSYRQALERGWSPDNIRGLEATREELAAIDANPAAFVDKMHDPEAKGGPIRMPDGTTRLRLPGFRHWLWDGDFCGSIGFRWRPGAEDLPPYALGHIGYAVPPWKEGRGYATFGLGLMLRHAAAQGLRHVIITTDPDNIGSQRVITKNGGVLVERFRYPRAYGGGPGLRYRIDIANGDA